MFFIKKIFLRSALAKALNANRRILLPNPDKPQSFQLWLDEQSSAEIENCLTLLKAHFEVESVLIFQISTKKSKQLSQDEQLVSCTPAALSWMGKIIDEKLIEKLEKPSTLSLDFRKNQNLMGDFLLAKSSSEFKVNFNSDAAADLSLTIDKSTDLTTKFEQLKKYLNQLNGK